MEKHCERMRFFAHRMAERLFDMDLMLTSDHPGGAGFFAEAISESQSLRDKLEIIGFYYEHKGHLL